MKHYDEQLMAGIILNKGQVLEMKTGEGKTLAATTAAYLNALSGKGVQIMTPNDYLAARDAEWAKPLFEFLGMTVGTVVASDRNNIKAKQEAYKADITYCNATEFGFDYLKDNIANNPDQLTQRPFHFAIVDEADNVLIDIARTPLVLSGMEQTSSEIDTKIINAVQSVVKDFEKDVDYEIDWTKGQISLIKPENFEDPSIAEEKICKALNIDSLYKRLPTGKPLIGYVNNALHANFMKEEGVDYEIKELPDPKTNKIKKTVVIVDESTGRLKIGSQWVDGLHQATEAKHHLEISPEQKTIAQATYQNLFKMFPKLSGMTGTAMSAEQEFSKVYEMPPVTEIPTHKPNARVDLEDQVVMNKFFKFHRVVESILDFHRQGRPILVGTTSVDDSEELSAMLTDSESMRDFVTSFSAAKLDETETEFKQNNKNLVEALTKLSEDPTSIRPETLNTLAKQYQEKANQVKVYPISIHVSLKNKSVDFNQAAAKKHILEVWSKELEQLAKTIDTIQAIDNGELSKHQVLNAKQDKDEADIVAQAGRLNAITIATNMAGRGTDIKLGGDPERLTEMQFIQEGRDLASVSDAEFNTRLDKNKIISKTEKKKVVALGGLHVIGTQRHDDRRVDNQLRGRAGRQGDPGSSQFFVSFDDDIVRETNLDHFLERFKDNKSQPYPIEHKLASKIINMAQDAKQMNALESRKDLLDYDDVYQEQRLSWYKMHREILTSSPEKMIAIVHDITQHVSDNLVQSALKGIHDDLDDKLSSTTAETLAQKLNQQFPVVLNISAGVLENKTGHQAIDTLNNYINYLLLNNMSNEPETLAKQAKFILLTNLLVNPWQSHIKELEILQMGVKHRALAQVDPKIEFQREAYQMYGELKQYVQESLIRTLLGTTMKIDVLATKSA